MWSETQTVPFYISTDTSLPNTLVRCPVFAFSLDNCHYTHGVADW